MAAHTYTYTLQWRHPLALAQALTNTNLGLSQISHQEKLKKKFISGAHSSKIIMLPIKLDRPPNIINNQC